MGSFGGGLETLAIEFDPRSILAAVAVANKNIESLEGTTEKTAKGMQRDWEGVATLLVKVADKSKNAADSYVRSLERQAAAVGKSGIDKLNAQMEQAIKNYGYSESAINKITAAYQKMAEAQEKGAQGFSAGTRAGMGARDFFEGRNAYAAVEFGKGLAELRGAPAILGAVAAGLVATTAAAFEAAKSLGETGAQMRDVQLRTGFSAQQLGAFSYAAKAAGSDVSVFERLMRGLSTAVDETGTKGEKARTILEGMGVDVQGLRDGSVDVADAIQKVGKAFEENGNTILTDKNALDLFKRAGIDSIPVLKELDENLRRAKEAGIAFNQGDIDRWRDYLKTTAEIEIKWGLMVDHAKEWLVYIVQGAAALHNVKQFMPGATGENTPSTPKPGEIPRFGQIVPDAGVPGADLSGTPSVNWLTPQLQAGRSGAMNRDLQSLPGLEYQLQQKQQVAAEKTRDYLEAGTNATLEQRQAWVDAEAAVKKYTDAIKTLKAEPNYANALEGFSLKADQGLVKQLEDNRHAADELRKQYPGHAQAIGQQEYLNIDAILKEFSDKAAIALQKGAEKAAEEQVKMAEERSSIENSINQQNMKSLAEAAKSGIISTGVPGEGIQIPLTPGMGTPPGPSSRQQADLTKDMLAQESKRIELMGGPGGELAAARQILELKKQALSIDEGQAELEAGAITNQTEREKKIFDIRLEYARQVYDAESQYQDKLLERQKQVAETAAGLYHTLFTNPKKFAPQLENTLKEAALKPVTEGLGNLTAQAIFGGNRNGGLTDVRSTNGAMHVFVTNLGGGGQGPAPITGFSGGGTVSVPFPGGGAFSIPSGGPSSSSTVSLPYFGASGPLFGGGTTSTPSFGAAGPISSGSTGGGFSLPSLFGGFGGGNPASRIGPGGTSGFAGPLGGLFKLGGSGGGFNLGSIFGRGPNPGPSASDQPGWTGTAAPPPGGYDPGASSGSTAGASALSKAGGSIANFGASAGIGFGSQIFMQGATGRYEGSAKGIGETTLGGTMMGAGIGFEVGGPIGAAIGAGVGAVAGALTGVGEMLAGVMSPQAKASMYAKQMYGITINDNMQNQIVNIANQSYAGNIQLAVRSPQVRQMLGLYAAGTGQANAKALMDSTPHGAGLSQQNGTLFQDTSYLYGASYKYSSSLPTLGGTNTTQTYNSPSGYSGSQPPVVIQNLTLPVGEKSVAAFLTGQVVTSDYVADQYNQSLMNSNNRVSNSAILQEPGLITS